MIPGRGERDRRQRGSARGRRLLPKRADILFAFPRIEASISPRAPAARVPRMSGKCPVDRLDLGTRPGDCRNVPCSSCSGPATVTLPESQIEQRPRRTHTVALLAADPAPAIEFVVPTAVFGAPHRAFLRDLHSVQDWYELSVWDQNPTDRGLALGMSPRRYRRTVRRSAEDRADARSA
jgi:hypothetical protein